MARMSRDDWIEAGFAILVKLGREGLAAERLAGKLGVTRGSFYHHFGSAEGYARTLLGEWERRSTEQIIAFSRMGETVPQRAKRLNEGVLGARHELDVAIRAWALRDATAQTFQARVDARRTEYVREIYTDMLGNAVAARLAAEVVYLCFVGAQQVHGRASRTQLEAVIAGVRAVAFAGARAAATRRSKRLANPADSRTRRKQPPGGNASKK